MMEEAESSNTRQLSLFQAVSNGATMEVVASLISPRSINTQDKYGNTVLHTAVCEKRWELVPLLMQHGADVKDSNIWHRTVLYEAAYCGAPLDIITQLMSPHNINFITLLDSFGEKVLCRVMRQKRWEVVRVLLRHGPDALVDIWYINHTSLHVAAFNGAPADIVTQLISPHIINRWNMCGHTPLHEAVREKRWELLPVLLQHGADPFIPGILPEAPRPHSFQSLTIATIISHMPVKSDEALEQLGLPHVLPELKLKPLAYEIVAVKQLEDL